MKGPTVVGDTMHVEVEVVENRVASKGNRALVRTSNNVVNQRVAVSLLMKRGHDVTLVDTGAKAVEAVANERFDIVLMDVQMPEMDGLDATREICSRWPQSERPRIVAMTANAMQGDRDMCLAAGMDDYLTKPIRVERLMEALAQVKPRVTPVT